MQDGSAGGDLMRERRSPRTARTIRQDASFVVSLLLLLAVVLSILTALGSDEAEFFGLGDDLHGLMGWSMVVLTALHTILHGGHMINYAKRRMRNRFGVGGVICSEPDRRGHEQPRPGFDETEAR